MKVWMHEGEDYPVIFVHKKKQDTYREYGVEVPDELAFRYFSIRKEFLKVTKKMQRYYNKADK